MPINLESIDNLIAEASWYLPPTVRPSFHPEYSKYTNLQYQGTVPAGTNFGTRNCYREFHPISSCITQLQRIKDIAKDEYFVVKPTVDNFITSLRSLENRPPIKCFDDFLSECFNYSSSHFDACYMQIFDDCVATNEETIEYIDFSKSSGYIGTHSNLRTKHDLAIDPNFSKWFRENKHLDTIPLWSVHPKIEFKNLSDINLNKIRLFTIPPYDLLYEQIRFGKRPTLKLKNHLWSAYGFNPYSGGADKLARRLLKYHIQWCLDISGWDKYLPLMKDFYKTLYNHQIKFIPQHLKKNYIWMIKNTVEFFFKTPYGDVFLKKYGNPSGSGCTTRDNTCIHIKIIACGLIYAYHKKFNKFPSSALLNEMVICVFGDDVIGSVSDDFDYVLTPNFWQDIYASFGLKLKFVKIGRDILDDLEFLGFHFKKINEHYYPLYDVTRLATSFIYKGVDNNNYDAYISRAFTLMVMSYPTNEFELFYKSYQDICDHFYTLNIEPSPTVMAFLTYRNLPHREIDALYTGVESSYDFPFFLSLDDVGCCNVKFK